MFLTLKYKGEVLTTLFLKIDNHSTLNEINRDVMYIVVTLLALDCLIIRFIYKTVIWSYIKSIATCLLCELLEILLFDSALNFWAAVRPCMIINYLPSDQVSSMVSTMTCVIHLFKTHTSVIYSFHCYSNPVYSVIAYTSAVYRRKS